MRGGISTECGIKGCVKFVTMGRHEGRGRVFDSGKEVGELMGDVLGCGGL